MIDSHAFSPSATKRILLLGGTSEGSAMARALAEAGIEAVFSYAGRTASPIAQPLPMRIGGFGGIAGLVRYISAQGITHLVDATHPFAAQMSAHAVAACAQTGIALAALERQPWAPQQGDDWRIVPDLEAAAAALPATPARVFLAIGRQNLALFAGQKHHYLLRLVDPAPQPLVDATIILDRGPFTVAGDLALLRSHAITHIVAKNAGGSGASAKLEAARQLGLPVILIDRPAVPPRFVCHSVDQVMRWLHAGNSEERGV
jgi:precorrin-6A/cobalt-precorrin-6A reductase